jgi:hypothetical protein
VSLFQEILERPGDMTFSFLMSNSLNLLIKKVFTSELDKEINVFPSSVHEHSLHCSRIIFFDSDPDSEDVMSREYADTPQGSHEPCAPVISKYLHTSSSSSSSS